LLLLLMFRGLRAVRAMDGEPTPVESECLEVGPDSLGAAILGALHSEAIRLKPARLPTEGYVDDFVSDEPDADLFPPHIRRELPGQVSNTAFEPSFNLRTEISQQYL